MVVRSVVVIGGGVAGLEAARQLARDGDRVVVLEAGLLLGGAIRAESLAGVRVDVGAEAFAITRPEAGHLVDELGLAPEVVAPWRWDARVLLDDGLHDLPNALLGVPTDLASEGVESVIGADQARLARERDSAPVGVLDFAGTLGALVRDRMGDAVAERILTPVVAGVHAADPDLLETQALIPGLLDAFRDTGSLAAAAQRLRAASGVPGSAVAGLRGGMTALVRALEREVRERGVVIHANSPALAVHRMRDGWRVEVESGSIDADDVVCAVDAPAASRLLVEIPDVSSALGRIVVGEVLVCAAVVHAPELDGYPVGSGVLVAPGHPSVRAKALTHATAKWDWLREAYGRDRHLVRLSYGRDGRVEERPEDLASIVRADVAAICDIPEPELLDLHATRWDRSLVLARPGHMAAVAALHAAVDDEPALAVVGAGTGGNGLAGTIGVSLSVRARLDGR